MTKYYQYNEEIKKSSIARKLARLERMLAGNDKGSQESESEYLRDVIRSAHNGLYPEITGFFGE